MVLEVLLIQDDPLDAALTEKHLSGHRVTRAETLGAGLERLRSGSCHLVLLDLTLPDSAGVASVARVREADPAVPLVVLTGTEDQEAGVQALRAGAQEHLTKRHMDLLPRALLHARERARLQREMAEANEQLQRLANRDPLTGILNRRGLEQALLRESLWSRRREGRPLIALLVDLDDFKTVNDELGHNAGDALLREVAGRLAASVRQTDYVARIGGDEFMVLLPDARAAEGRVVAEKLRRAVEALREPTSITASVGLVAVDRPADSLEELLGRASKALRRGKRSGKNRVCLYGMAGGSPLGGPDPQAIDAIRRGDRFRTLAHPVVRLADLEAVGYELLSRLEVRGCEHPDRFFPLSIESDLLTVADENCYRNAAAAAANLPGPGRAHLNLFPSTILERTAFPLLELLPPGTFCIDVSEPEVVGEPSLLAAALADFRRAGVQIALDDLGFGRSSLESLLLLEPDLVKIDPRCIQGIARDPGRRRFAQRLVRVSRCLGARVVAEGVEQEDDLAVLRELGVEYGQGFLWGRPLPLNGA